MTREEEIRRAAEEYSGLPKYQDPYILGAQWADEHPKQKEEHQRGLCGNMIN